MWPTDFILDTVLDVWHIEGFIFWLHNRYRAVTKESKENEPVIPLDKTVSSPSAILEFEITN